MNGIIFFENGEVAQFGTLSTVRNIARAVNETIPKLIQQERDQLLDTVTKEELRLLIDRHADSVVNKYSESVE